MDGIYEHNTFLSDRVKHKKSKCHGESKKHGNCLLSMKESMCKPPA